MATQLVTTRFEWPWLAGSLARILVRLEYCAASTFIAILPSARYINRLPLTVPRSRRPSCQYPGLKLEYFPTHGKDGFASRIPECLPVLFHFGRAAAIFRLVLTPRRVLRPLISTSRSAKTRSRRRPKKTGHLPLCSPSYARSLPTTTHYRKPRGHAKSSFKIR